MPTKPRIASLLRRGAAALWKNSACRPGYRLSSSVPYRSHDPAEFSRSCKTPRFVVSAKLGRAANVAPTAHCHSRLDRKTGSRLRILRALGRITCAKDSIELSVWWSTQSNLRDLQTAGGFASDLDARRAWVRATVCCRTGVPTAKVDALADTAMLPLFYEIAHLRLDRLTYRLNTNFIS